MTAVAPGARPAAASAEPHGPVTGDHGNGPGRGLRPTARGVGTAVVAVALLAAGVLLGNPVLRGLGGFAAGALAVALVPSLVRLRPAVERTVRPTRLERGQQATARLAVRNDTGQRQPGFTARDRVGGAVATGFVDVAVPTLRPGRSSEHRYAIPAVRRGRIDVGPFTVERADPLGLARSRTEVGDVVPVWVHPRRLPARVAGGGRLRHHHEGVPGDRPLRGSADVRALRAYLPGDELRHVHWRASARAGHLIVREYVDPVRPQCTVVLDNRPTALSADAFEEAVEVAASVLWAAAAAGHRVTLCTADGDVLPAAEQAPLLDRLAAVTQTDGADLVGALEVTTRGARGGWLIVVTGAADREVLGRLVGLAGTRGGYAPVTVFDVSGWPDAATTPGVVTVRGATARGALDRWNALS